MLGLGAVGAGGAPVPSTTTTTVAAERAQPGWTVASRSARGVMVDYRNVVVGATTFRVLRLRARTTLLRWHVGSTDPTRGALAPADAGPSIDWPVEGRAGVVAVFNGAFKQAAGAGGSIADGLTLVPMLRGRMTIAIDAAGSWAMGQWGSPNFPPRGFSLVSARQNLGALVWNGRVTPSALSPNWRQWGDPLHEVPTVARSGLGVDANGNLLYVATMQPVLAGPLARALVAAGAVMGMELDINPFWPILGAPFAPLHQPGPMPVQLPLSEHSPTIYATGWTRDFFVALAEPASWGCWWSGPGITAAHVPEAQPLTLHGARCAVTRRPPKATTTTAPRPTTTIRSTTTTTTTTTTTPVSSTTTAATATTTPAPTANRS